MRASELLGARVVAADGRPVGFVTGLRCRLDGPSEGPVRAPRLRTLVVTRRRVGAFLGYQQDRQRGPWLVHRVVSLLHRHTELVDWDSVGEVSPGEIRLHGSRPER
jgi:hypothetical protein